MIRPVAGSMEDVQGRVFIADHRRRKARRLSQAGHIEAAVRIWNLAEAMFESAGERYMHGTGLESRKESN